MSDVAVQPAQPVQAPAEPHGDNSAHGEHPKVPYFLIAGTLLVMTVATVGISFVNLGSKPANVCVAMLVAGFKASLVMFFFMHLKYERTIMKFIAFAPFILAAVLAFALFPDVVYSQRPPNPEPPALHAK